jgi:hypothetical protein
MRKRDVAAKGAVSVFNLVVAAFWLLGGVACLVVGGSLWSSVIGIGALLYGLYGLLGVFGIWL